ncbi:hypothetical protein ACT4XR_19990 (plasmid) [Acinetobacter baumannii]|uniref:hypothetical protein n=1 Tax=Acinetobacter baumannii TaxID=470 RepID=UPI0038924EEC
MRKIGLLFFLPVIIAGCSSPATEAEIRSAVNECWKVSYMMEQKLKPKDFDSLKFGSSAKPVTSRQLNKLLKECKESRTSKKTGNNAMTVDAQLNVIDTIRYEELIKSEGGKK